MNFIFSNLTLIFWDILCRGGCNLEGSKLIEMAFLQGGGASKGGRTAEGQGRASHRRQRGGDGRHGRGAVTAWRKIDGASGSARIAHHQSFKRWRRT